MSADAAPPAVAVLVSGTGTNLQALIDAIASGSVPARICAVFSDQPTARGLERARDAGIDAHHVPIGRRRDTGYDVPLIEAVARYTPDLIVLAGYMRILSPSFIAQFAGRIINIHPSLLPRHKGLDTHRRVLQAGDTEHGATVHLVENELDSGPLLMQYKIPVRHFDTVETLTARVHQGEYIILPRSVKWFAEKRLSLDGDRVMLDGKPLDGPVIVEGK